MRVSNSIPVQIWPNGQETYNEKIVCGITKVCWCQPFECSDPVVVEFTDTTDYDVSIKIFDENDNELAEIELDKTSYSGGFLHSKSVIPEDYSICDKQIYIKFYSTEVVETPVQVTENSGFTGTLDTWTSEGPHDAIWEYGSNNANINPVGYVAPTNYYEAFYNDPGDYFDGWYNDGGVPFAVAWYADSGNETIAATLETGDTVEVLRLDSVQSFLPEHAFKVKIIMMCDRSPATDFTLVLKIMDVSDVLVSQQTFFDSVDSTGVFETYILEFNSSTDWLNASYFLIEMTSPVSADTNIYLDEFTVYFDVVVNTTDALHQTFSLKPAGTHRLTIVMPITADIEPVNVTIRVDNGAIPMSQVIKTFEWMGSPVQETYIDDITITNPFDRIYCVVNTIDPQYTLDEMPISMIDLVQLTYPTIFTEIGKTDCLSIKESHPCTTLIEYSNATSFDGIPDQSPMQLYYLRIPAVFFEEQNITEQEDIELSNDEIVRLYDKIEEKRLLQIGFMPHHMHRKTLLSLSYDFVRLDNKYWIRRDEYKKNEGDRHYPLKTAQVLLTDKNFIKENQL